MYFFAKLSRSVICFLNILQFFAIHKFQMKFSASDTLIKRRSIFKTNRQQSRDAKKEVNVFFLFMNELRCFPLATIIFMLYITRQFVYAIFSFIHRCAKIIHKTIIFCLNTTTTYSFCLTISMYIVLYKSFQIN